MYRNYFLCILLMLALFIVLIAPSSYSQESELEKAGILNQQMAELYKQKRFSEAVSVAEKVLSIKQKELGPEHPEVAQSLNNLGEIHRSLGNYLVAEPLFKRALIIAEKALGPEHPAADIIRRNLVVLYKSRGEYAKVRAIEGKTVKTTISKRSSENAVEERPKDISKKLDRKISMGKPTPDSKIPLSESRSYPYSLLLSSFRNLKRVKKAITDYSKNNLSPYWVKVDLKEKGVWYRVFAGHFEDREQAARFRQKHGLTDSLVMKTQYANLIGVYSSGDELKAKIMSLKDLGYSLYVIKDQDGKSRLFIGAFKTKTEAEEQFNDLKSHNVQSQVVKR